MSTIYAPPAWMIEEIRRQDRERQQQREVGYLRLPLPTRMPQRPPEPRERPESEVVDYRIT